MSFKSFIFFLSLLAAVSALATHVRSPHHHRALAARSVTPSPLSQPPLSIRRRANGKRCKSRPLSSPVAPSPTPSPAAVKGPDTHTSAHEEPTSTREQPKPPKPSPPPPPPTQAPQPKPPATTPKPPATTKPSNGGGGGGSGGPSFMTGVQTGQGTFYDTGLGSCGIVNNDNDLIAAVSHLLYDKFPGYNGGNPNNNPICNRKVRATFQGKSVTVAITDRCEGCALTDLDFSPKAFNTIADPSLGRISGMTWEWV